MIHFSIKCITLIPQRIDQVCCYCNYQFTDLLLHIVTSCQLTLHIRDVFLEFVVDHYTPTFSVYVTSLDNDVFLQFLLGKTSKETEARNDDEYKILMMQVMVIVEPGETFQMRRPTSISTVRCSAYCLNKLSSSVLR